MLNVYPIRLRFISARLLASAPHMCKSPPLQELFFLDSSLFMFMADWRAATALSACIFLPLLLCSGGVFPLPLQKPQMLFDRPRMDVVPHSNKFDISAPKTADAFSSSKKDTASIAVRKQPSLYMYVTHPYRRNWLWEKFLFFNIMLKTQLIK